MATGTISVQIPNEDGSITNLTASLADGVVTTTPPPAPTATISASPATVTAGDPATLTWSTTNATAVSIAPGIGVVAASGSAPVSPSATTEYTLTATGNGGTVGSVTTVTVQAPPPPPPPPAEPVIPSTAVVVDLLPAAIAWEMNHDAGTPGSATGTTTYPVTNPADGTTCRQFQFTLTAGGGEIYHVKALTNSSAYDTFCYEAVESSPDWSNVACAEKDLEQADSTGTYVDMATQLNGHAKVVDVSNSGWKGTSVVANPMTRAANVKHTTRVYVQNLGATKILYIGISIDGTYYPLGITATSTPASKWGDNILNVQLQYDGLSSGSVETTVFMSVLNIHCWKS